MIETILLTVLGFMAGASFGLFSRSKGKEIVMSSER